MEVFGFHAPLVLFLQLGSVVRILRYLLYQDLVTCSHVQIVRKFSSIFSSTYDQSKLLNNHVGCIINARIWTLDVDRTTITSLPNTKPVLCLQSAEKFVNQRQNQLLDTVYNPKLHYLALPLTFLNPVGHLGPHFSPSYPFKPAEPIQSMFKPSNRLFALISKLCSAGSDAWRPY